MIEEVLGAPLRIRILLALWKWGEVNMTELAHILNTNYNQLALHLKLLVDYGLVEEKRIGRARLVKLRDAEPIHSLLQALALADKELTKKTNIESSEKPPN